MMKPTLLLMVLLALIAAACTADAEPTPDLGVDPVQGTCLEGAPDCEDTNVDGDLPLPTSGPAGTCLEGTGDCNDTPADGPTGLMQDPQATPGEDGQGSSGTDTVTSDVQGLSVAEALSYEGGEPVAVAAFLVADADGTRMCDALAESFPPQCGGDGALRVEGLDLDELPVAEEGDVRWTDEPVIVFGTVSGGTLIVSTDD